MSMVNAEEIPSSITASSSSRSGYKSSCAQCSQRHCRLERAAVERQAMSVHRSTMSVFRG
jgi:hypothetical protein